MKLRLHEQIQVQIKPVRVSKYDLEQQNFDEQLQALSIIHQNLMLT